MMPGRTARFPDCSKAFPSGRLSAMTQSRSSPSTTAGPADQKGGLTHFDAGGHAHMVDVGGKAETHRVARASGRIVMLPATLQLIQQGGAKKGDVLGVARIAAIQAA